MNIFQKFGDWLEKQLRIFRLQREVSRLQKQLDEIYGKLGRDYVDTHRNDPDDLNHDLIEEALHLRNAIAEKNSAIDEMRGIIRCVACGERIPEGSAFCPYCGMRQPDPEVRVVRYCPTCGTKLEVDEIFCHNCGTRIPQDDAPTEEIHMRREVSEDTDTIVVPEAFRKQKEEEQNKEK